MFFTYIVSNLAFNVFLKNILICEHCGGVWRSNHWLVMSGQLAFPTSQSGKEWIFCTLLRYITVELRCKCWFIHLLNVIPYFLGWCVFLGFPGGFHWTMLLLKRKLSVSVILTGLSERPAGPCALNGTDSPLFASSFLSYDCAQSSKSSISYTASLQSSSQQFHCPVLSLSRYTQKTAWTDNLKSSV